MAPVAPKTWSGRGRPPSLMRRDSLVSARRVPSGSACQCGSRGVFPSCGLENRSNWYVVGLRGMDISPRPTRAAHHFPKDTTAFARDLMRPIQGFTSLSHQATPLEVLH
jgi:hypothetical protein